VSASLPRLTKENIGLAQPSAQPEIALPLRTRGRTQSHTHKDSGLPWLAYPIPSANGYSRDCSQEY
jgi:hypothetical protein